MSLYRRSAESITDGNGISSIGVCHFVLCKAPAAASPVQGEVAARRADGGVPLDTAPGLLKRKSRLFSLCGRASLSGTPRNADINRKPDRRLSPWVGFCAFPMPVIGQNSFFLSQYSSISAWFVSPSVLCRSIICLPPSQAYLQFTVSPSFISLL